MGNLCSSHVDAAMNVLLAALMVGVVTQGGYYIVLAIALYEVVRVLRLNLLKKKLDGKTVLITGGGSGLGRKMALMMAKQGAKIVLWDVNEAGLKKVQGEIGSKNCRVNVVDVTDKDKVYDAARSCGDVDVLINNAGIVSAKSFSEVEERLMVKTMEVNAIAHFWTCKAFLPAMIERKSGTVVSIASQAGNIGVKGLTDYSASKFAANGFAEALRMEMHEKNTGVNVLSVNPFYINTGMFDGATSKNPLLPMLEEDQVAARVVDGIRCDEAVINLPPTANILPVTRFLPITAFHALAKVLGVSDSMNDFKGRAAK